MLRSNNFSEAKQTQNMFYFKKTLSYFCNIEFFKRKQEIFLTVSNNMICIESKLQRLDSSPKHMIELFPCLDSLKTAVEIICSILESKHDKKPDLL